MCAATKALVEAQAQSKVVAATSAAVARGLAALPVSARWVVENEPPADATVDAEVAARLQAVLPCII